MDRASHRGGLGRLSPRQRRRHPDAAQADRPRRPGTLSARRADAARRRLIVADSEDPPSSEEHTSELQSLMRISYAVFCLKNKTYTTIQHTENDTGDQYTNEYHS